MRSRDAQWFETKIRYEKELGDGVRKKVTEAYALDAFNFTEAEEEITEEMSSYISGEFTVTNIAKAPYGEVYFSDNPNDDKWYKVKVQFITIDEKSQKEKLTATTYLVQSDTLQNAVKNIEKVMETGMQDWRLASVTETALMDVFEHDGTKHGVKVEEDDRPEYEDALAQELQAEHEEQQQQQAM